MYNVKDTKFSYFTHVFIDKAYSLPTSKFSMKTDWINSLTIYYIGVMKMMIAEGKSFKKKASGEYDTANLHTPYMLVVLMVNMIFGRANGRF